MTEHLRDDVTGGKGEAERLRAAITDALADLGTVRSAIPDYARARITLRAALTPTASEATAIGAGEEKPLGFRAWLAFSIAAARYNPDALDPKAATILENALARYDVATPKVASDTAPGVETLALQAIKAVTATAKDGAAGLSRIMAIARAAGVQEPYSELLTDPDVALIVERPRTEWAHLFKPDTAGCCLPPDGWCCTRERGHSGPCAALAASPTASDTDTAIPGGGGLSERALHWRLMGLAATLRSEEFDEDSSSALDVEEAARRLAASPKPDTDTPVDPGVEGVVRKLLIRAGMHEGENSAIGLIPYSIAARAVAEALAAKPIAGMGAGE